MLCTLSTFISWKEGVFLEKGPVYTTLVNTWTES